MGQLIDGLAIAAKIRTSVAMDVKKLKKKNIKPKLGVILVGNDKPSQTYVEKKQQAAETAGIGFVLKTFPATIYKNKLVEEIKKIQKKERLSGLIIQLPLPEKLYVSEVLNAVDPSIDVDCLTDTNIGKLVMRTNYIFPPTPYAVITILKEINCEIAGKNITIVGMGALVGKPLAIILSNEGASVITCNSRTRDIKEKCLMADVIVTGVGKKDLLRGDMVKPGAIIIDTGIVFENGKMYGDSNREEVLPKSSYFTPTPGGVGPITVALLLQNTVLCAKHNIKK
ncbi:MAG: bifunctional 5,10-methylenetetrahydrofolate dehydrogenase/5,10-methenyltetrahydrofolate cyclohydrolase [Candidatus Magasanikbacteria bacterium]|jgi:methylenetetrahydrofolate dehydrogenase (NADP+)/methenyltetrahydrofolate cyclohydrolase